MNLIKKIVEGNRSLEHYQYVDNMGFLKDSFEIIETDDKGLKTLIPFFGDIKVNTLTRDTPIGDFTQEYTDEEYKEMLHRNI